MNACEKIKHGTLREIANTHRSAISSSISDSKLSVLVTGNLSHIGTAIIEGKTILFDGLQMLSGSYFDSSSNLYTIKNESMNKCEKINKLMNHEKVSKEIQIHNFMRLVDGDLRHIGDALLDGLDILCNKCNQSSYAFFTQATSYTIKDSTITLNNMKVPSPLTSKPKLGDGYFHMSAGEAIRYIWRDDSFDYKTFDSQPTFKSASDCEKFYSVLMRAVKQ